MWIIPSNHPLQSAFAQECADSKKELNELLNHFGVLSVQKKIKGKTIVLEVSKLPYMWRSKPLPVKNLVSQMEQGLLAAAPIWSNLKTFQQFAHLFRGKIDLITGGYPCQPFSNAGDRLGAEDPRHLWPYIGKGKNSIVGTIRPFCCFFENVEGHLTLGYREVRADLEELGYRVTEGIFSAEEAGAPHQRKRLFILAILDDTSGNGLESGDEVSTRRNSPEHAGKTMGDATIKHEGSQTGEDGKIKSGRPGKKLANSDSKREQQQKGNIGKIRRRISDSSTELADSRSLGSETRISGPVQRQKGFSGVIDNSGLQTKWPARPGEEQYDWEQPRIESGLGCTVNGYNFREDLLRLLGNAVVEQTAEIAFRTLLMKHCG